MKFNANDLIPHNPTGKTTPFHHVIIRVMACVCLASGDEVSAPLSATHDHAWTPRRTARRRKRYRVPRLREGVMLFPSSLSTHAAEPHAAQSHNSRSRTRKLELNGHFKTTHGVSPCGPQPQHCLPHAALRAPKLKWECVDFVLRKAAHERGESDCPACLSFIHFGITSFPLEFLTAARTLIGRAGFSPHY